MLEIVYLIPVDDQHSDRRWASIGGRGAKMVLHAILILQRSHHDTRHCINSSGRDDNVDIFAMGTYNKLFSLIFFSSMKGLGQVRSHLRYVNRAIGTQKQLARVRSVSQHVPTHATSRPVLKQL